MTYLGYRGTLVCVGLPKGTVFEVDPAAMVVNSFRIVGSSLSNRAEAKEALAFVAMGKVKVELTYRHMSEIADVYKELEAGQVSAAHYPIRAAGS